MPDPASGSVTVPVLIVTGGPLDGTLFEVDDSPRDRLIGSSSDCDLQILLGNVEPVHAKVTRGARGMLLAPRRRIDQRQIINLKARLV